MRISTSWSQYLGVSAMQEQQVKLSKTQLQLSSGLQILKPSDDPVAASKIIEFDVEIKQTNQYLRNIDVVEERNNLEESALVGAEAELFRAKELTVQAANATLNKNDKLSIKAEIDQILLNMVGIANTKNANGEYIFSGDLSRVPAVKLNNVSKEYDYTGGVHQRSVAIAAGRQVADGDLGSNVFFNIESSSFEANATEQGTQSIFRTLQNLSDALGAEFSAPDANLTGSRFMRYGADYSVNNSTFELTTNGVDVATIVMDQDYPDIETLVTAVNSQIQVQGFDDKMQARVNGNAVEFVSLSNGRASNIQVDTVAGTFLTDIGLKTGQASVGADLDDLGSISGGQSLAAGKDYSAPADAQFELKIDGDVAISIVLDQNYADLDSIVAAVNTQLSTAGISTKLEAVTNNNVIEFRSLTKGQDSFIQIKNQKGNFLTDAGFEELQSGKGLDENDLFNESMNTVLTDFDASLESLLVARTNVGARLRAIEDQYGLHENTVLDMQSIKSSIQDLDYTEAISRFESQALVLQASQQAFTRVKELSLFNFL